MNLRHRVSTATFSDHLKKLCGEVLDRRVEENGHSYYSLTERFKAVLGSEMKYAQPPEDQFLRNTFSRFDRSRRRSFGKNVSFEDYHSGNYRIGRKRKPK